MQSDKDTNVIWHKSDSDIASTLLWVQIKSISTRVCVCVCPHINMITFLQVYDRAEFRLAGGDLPANRLLPRTRQPQRDFWRLQRASQVSRSRSRDFCVVCVFTALIRKEMWSKSWRQLWWNRPWEKWNAEELWSRRMSQGEVGGREPASESFYVGCLGT